MLDLRELTRELLRVGWQRGGTETAADNAVVKTINGQEQDLAARKRSLVEWLNLYRVFMGLPTETRDSIAGQIIAFADGRLQESLQLDQHKIITEFERLNLVIGEMVPHNKTGIGRGITSLVSKALWCCYPNDVPIFDRNAARALGVISRLCRLAPRRDQSEYARFVDVWFQVYWRVESVIEPSDLYDCPFKVRALDRILWYLGQDGFYDQNADHTSA